MQYGYEKFNENSILGQNQFIIGPDPEVYARGELPVPPAHHKNLNATDRHNMYPEQYPDAFENPEGCVTVIPPAGPCDPTDETLIKVNPLTGQEGEE